MSSYERRIKWISFCIMSIPLFLGRKRWHLKSRAIVVGRWLWSLSGFTFAGQFEKEINANPATINRVLVISNQITATTRQNTIDLIEGFQSLVSDGLIVDFHSPDEFGCVKGRSSKFDCVVICYDVLELRTTPWWHDFLRSVIRLRANQLQCRFIVLVQDDYTASALLDHFFCKINPHIVFTGASAVSNIIYPNFFERGGIFNQCLTSYVRIDDAKDIVASWTSISDRKWDIGSRVRFLNAMFGERGSYKANQVKEVERFASSLGLSTNLSTDPADFFYGRDWLEFLEECRAVPSTSGGSSIVDKQGWLTSLVFRYQSTGREWDLSYLGKWTRSMVFECDIKGFSPRIFEAAQAGCLLFLDQNSETLNLTMNVDYVPIGSDIELSVLELSRVLNNPVTANQMRLNAYNKLIMSGLFDVHRFARQVISLKP